MGAPYSPEKYKKLVKEASDIVGPDGVVIVDSFSHAWNNEGGILDIKEKIAAQSNKNSYTAWNEAGQEQNRLVNYILSVDSHTIVTMRSKMDYIQTENAEGKKVIKKVGLAPIQRDDTEYEFDIVLNIDRNHVATASKDTTFLDRLGEVITPELGTHLIKWINEGQEPEKLICEECGNVIKGNEKASAKRVAEYSMKIYGKQLCADCGIKYKKGEIKNDKN